jgi:AcrR family transcriptional regulator
MKSSRTYTMTARARATEQTRHRILEATIALVGERLLSDISLDLIADRAEVSVQTVLRHFGSRVGLFAAAEAYGQTLIGEERQAPVGDVTAAVRVLVDHYERRGDAVLLMLAQESTEPVLASVTRNGKQLHRAWVATTFAPYLPEDADAADELLDLLVVATDVYTWKLLRRDRRLGRAHTEARVRRLVHALLGSS